ncbi:hypothetical protein [Klebsiella aerogenes]|uniref:hypothetical protein n=1 Tax=Klebsiella aerogenes TaxID=548 RepID=UPI0010403114|nr:hypothetical protein [Klebsiella aerogenes]ELA0086642.1 hypothetical protein [Klebsiella aerogenes]ELA0209134.1 hypothetical protein [Klebsiella aerogenes]ELA0230238.1 hypothetical protein [Klebsiella aerogenes]HBR7000839.1 hypothetical protein [Klebsiella aerogenes]
MMEHIPFRAASESISYPAYLTQENNEPWSDFSSRVASVNHYSGPVRGIMRTNSSPRNYYSNIAQQIVRVNGGEGEAVSTSIQGNPRRDYHIRISPNKSKSYNKPLREHRVMSSTNENGSSATMAMGNKYSRPGIVQRILRCIIPCLKTRS